MKMLIIEDDRGIIETIGLACHIRWPDIEVISTAKGRDGIELVETANPDLVLLDLGLPDISGFDVLKKIRSFSSVPTMIITVMAQEMSIVRGLEMGADEYLVKPFGQLELLARLQALMRRQGYQSAEQPPIARGPLVFGPGMSTLLYNGKRINLSRTEGIVLYELMKNTGGVLTNTRLAQLVWGDYYDSCDDNIRAYIRRLRMKLEVDPHHPRLIRTKIGIGYYLEVPDSQK